MTQFVSFNKASLITFARLSDGAGEARMEEKAQPLGPGTWGAASGAHGQAKVIHRTGTHNVYCALNRV